MQKRKNRTEGGPGTLGEARANGQAIPKNLKEPADFQPQKAMRKAARTATTLDPSKKALHLCLKRIKESKDENELRRLTEELQRIVFHRAAPQNRH